jgi:alanyl-tRNA synthetase
MKSAEIRQAFLDYFASKQHSVVASSSLVPGNDPTLLFTNAGMVQFKDVFLGQDKRAYSRACSSQRCVRAGGKHNDLENVGYTARHHTFFEMLGNFSFGDYFKREAIQFAWEFLTEVLKLPQEKLWVTVHVSDDEAADIWLKEVGVSAERFSRLDEDNFWQMGDTGPCGPSSEIFFDHGEDIFGDPPGGPNDDGDRYIEIWNLVFMQYERQSSGELQALPKPSVDTGMGLERIAAVLQGVHSNYEIDLFQALLDAAQKHTGTSDSDSKSLRVIADHIRSCAFLVADGVLPGNEGRAYVLRRIIRRALRHGHKLGQNDVFFYKLVASLVEQMGQAYPELVEQQIKIEKILKAEEEQFALTLEKGLAVLELELKEVQGTQIPGELVFRLYDTYGFPVDLTNDIARERELSLDLEGYEQAMSRQREQSKEAGKFKVDYTSQISLDGSTTFNGYERLESTSTVIAIYRNGESVEYLSDSDEAVVVLSETPFYGESGGQVGDWGTLQSEAVKFDVRDCQKSGGHHLHVGALVNGSIKVGDQITAKVDPGVRIATAKNHSATHLLHAALRQVLGDHVTQKGSLVDSEKLRFDFSHFEPVSDEQLSEIAALVNKYVQANTAVKTELCDMETAKSKGAMALFGEKYGEEVRVLSMGDDGFSVELCGGTHVARTGDIGLLYISAETGIASGVRRIEALTGQVALEALMTQERRVVAIAKTLKTAPDKLEARVELLIDDHKKMEKELAQLKAKLSSASADEWLSEAVEIAGIQVLAKSVEGLDAKSLRDLVDKLKAKLGRSAVLIAAINGGKASLVAGVSKDATDVVKAGDMVRHVALQLGGKGGGRPDMAQGGGTDLTHLDEAIASIAPFIESQL